MADGRKRTGGVRAGRVAALGVVLCMWAAAAAAQTYEDGLRSYRNGDVGTAFQVWSPLADEGHAQAQYGLAVLYEAGSSAVPKDDVKAGQWYRKAADAGIVAAQNNLALMYAQGRGVPRDVNMAAQWWQLAAKSGHAMAQYNLGLAYYRGEGVQRSYPEAIDWFRKAAGQGVRDAQYALGQMYLLGISVPKDDGRALGWYQLAAAQGHPQAKQQVDTLTKAGVAAVPPGTAPAAEPVAQSPLPLTSGNQAQTGTASSQVVGQPIKLTPEAPTTVQVTDLPATTQPAATQPAPVPASKPTSAATAQPAAPSTPKIVYENTPQRKPSDGSQAAAGTSAANAQTGGATGTSSASPTTTQQAAVRPAASGQFRVWLGSGADQAEANAMWTRLRRQHGGSLGPMEHWLAPAQGGFYRVLAGPLASRNDARRLCNSLRAGDPTTFCKPYQ